VHYIVWCNIVQDWYNKKYFCLHLIQEVPSLNVFLWFPRFLQDSTLKYTVFCFFHIIPFTSFIILSFFIQHSVTSAVDTN